MAHISVLLFMNLGLLLHKRLMNNFDGKYFICRKF
jgi:hypothetical protein